MKGLVFIPARWAGNIFTTVVYYPPTPGDTWLYLMRDFEEIEASDSGFLRAYHLVQNLLCFVFKERLSVVLGYIQWSKDMFMNHISLRQNPECSDFHVICI